jgi:polyhydroxyalkanoate synthesis regulator protein
MGIAAAFNVLIIKWKIENNRIGNAFLDGTLLFLLVSFFGDTLGGMVIATISSAIVSVYLLAFPPKMPSFLE